MRQTPSGTSTRATEGEAPTRKNARAASARNGQPDRPVSASMSASVSAKTAVNGGASAPASTPAKTAAGGGTTPGGGAPSKNSRRTSFLGPRDRRFRLLDTLTMIAGIVLLAAISWEIIAGDHMRFTQLYLTIQFVVCLVFLADFFIRWSADEHRGRFFRRHLLFLLLSIPWLNLIDWFGLHPTHDWGILVSLTPLLRAFLAMILVVRWLVSENTMRRIFWAYIFTVVVFTYISALMFYEYEAPVNDKLQGFGNALWWAWMNVTTVGAEIFAVTAVGKITTILLPSLGMMFFPIFTTYILQEYTHKGDTLS